ncbi:CvfB family protein [Geopsychrobacter electrodiphilus]|uniref:CvfB family protein n=1 Tax=Geopsychrobacter electrodiphilus TaxID=225196 RepID=UPI00036EC30B|nr:S1-like domain-containing RNA-binding protein [Geopsychrobacter electrodiphilus]
MKPKKLPLGKIITVTVERVEDKGAWLKSPDERFLLPKREIHQALVVGEALSVFIYRDEEGDIQTTLKLPLAEVGDFASLRVKKILPEGVMFDLGRGFELPVAIDEIPFRARENERTLVRVELDDDGMLCGSCRITDFLETPQELKVGQQVELMVWRTTDLGVKMIIDGRFEGLLYVDDRLKYQAGQRLVGFVARLREDGKIDLSLNPGGRVGIDIGRDKILQALEVSGFLPLNDDSAPEDIQRLLGLSKKQFKRALGGLYKEKKVELLQTGIRLTK